jgi:hypothetical protein
MITLTASKPEEPGQNRLYFIAILDDTFSQIAWKVHQKDGDIKRLIFAKTEAGAIRRSRLLKTIPKDQLVVERARYADGLKNDIYRLHDAMRANGWRV